MYFLFFFFKKDQQLISELDEMCSRRALGETGRGRPM